MPAIDTMSCHREADPFPFPFPLWAGRIITGTHHHRRVIHASTAPMPTMIMMPPVMRACVVMPRPASRSVPIHANGLCSERTA